MKRLNKWIYYFIGIFVILVALVIIYLHYSSQAVIPTRTPTVAVSKVRKIDYVPQLNVIGTLVAQKGVNVSSKVSGIVKEIYFHSGQEVKRGQLLVALDNNDIKASLAQNEAKYSLAMQNYLRYKALLKDNGISQSTFDNYVSQLKETEAAVNYEKALLSDTLIRAPFDGRLGIREINPGEFISAGQSLINLQASNTLYVDFSVPEKYVNMIAVGTPISVSTITLPGQLIKGHVTALNAQVELDTRSLPSRAILILPHSGKLYPGMYVQVAVEIGSHIEGLIVPQSAIAYSPLGEFVYEVVNNHAEQRMVTTAENIGNNVVVTKGLELSSVIVSAGQIKLHQGMLVKTVPFNGDGA